MIQKHNSQLNIASTHSARTKRLSWATVVLVCAYVITSVVGGFVYSSQASAAIPKYINFQGKLTAVSNGTNVANGTYAIEFKIYDALTSGTLLWTETYDQAPTDPCQKIQVTNGVFNTKLGSCASLAGVDFTGGSLFLTVNFAPTGTSYDGEMSPRKQLVSSAFAFVANSVSGDGVVNNAIQSATALSTGRTSANPALQVDTNTGSSVTGLKVTSAAAAGGVALAAISSGTNENLTLNAKGSGTISIGNVSTGNVLFGSSGQLSISNAAGTLSTTGNISTTGSGTVTSAGLLTSTGGLTSSGTITFSGLGGAGTKCLQTDNSGVVTAAAAACGTGALTPWTSDVDADGYDLRDLSNLEFRDTTGAPAGSVVAVFSDNTGDININSLTGKTTNIQVNGTDEYNFSSTALAMNSNNITGVGTAITATAGLTVTATAADLTLATATSGNITLAPASTGSVQVTSGVTTGTGTSSGLSVAANSLTTGVGVNLASSSLSSGSLLNLVVTGTAATSNTQKAIDVSTSGANATSTQTTYGGYFSNSHTGTASSNIALYAAASSGTATNKALQLDVTGGTNTIGLEIGSASAAPGSSSHTGIDIDARNFYASTTTLKGINISAGIQNGSYGATTVTGIQILAGAMNNGGTVATAYGLDASLTANNSASITTGSIIRAYAADVGAATYGTLYGLNLSGWSTLSATTTYGIYMDTSIDQGATRYALYSSSTSNSYMAGNLGLGDISPASLLTVGNGDLFQVNSSGAIAAVVGITNTGAQSTTVQSATALTVARTGTNYALQVDTNTASSATGIKITSAAAAAGVAIAAISSGTDEFLTLDAKGAGEVRIAGASTGSILFAGGAGSTGCTITTAGALTCDGAGSFSNLSGSSSGTNTGDVTLAAIGAVPNANGASLTGQSLNLQPANGSFGGVVTTTIQTFAGAKTFTSDVTVSKVDPSLVLVAPGSDTDFWLSVTDDGGNDDNDAFQIGDGATPGTNTLFSMDNAGNITLASGALVGLLPYSYFEFASNGHILQVLDGGYFMDTYNATGSGGYMELTGRTVDDTSGDIATFKVSPTVSPTSGTLTYAAATLYPTINQTGTATGVTRGLYVNPTITSSKDFRGMEASYTIAGALSASSNYGSKIAITNNQITNANTVYGQHISFTDAGSLANTVTGLYVDATTANTSDTTYAAIFQGGNVGIGNSAPTAKLVIGDVSTNGYFGFDVSTPNPTLYLRGEVTNGYYPNIDFAPQNNSALGGVIQSWSANGGLHIGNRGVNGALIVANDVSNRTNTILDELVVSHNTSGTPAANYGTGILISGETTTSPGQEMSRIASYWTDATHATRTSNLGFSTVDSGTMSEKLTIQGNGQVGIGTTASDARLELAGNQSQSAWGLNGIQLQATAATYTDSSTAVSGTATNAVFNSFAQPTLAATNATVTTTNASTVYIANAPATGTNQTITNAYALWVDDGNVRFDGNLTVTGTCTGCGGGSFSGEVDDVTNDALTFTSDDASPPAGTVNSIFRDNTGDLNINTVTGKTLNLQIAGTDEYNFSSTALAMNSNNITGVGTAITATAGLTVTATAADLTLATATSGNINVNSTGGTIELQDATNVTGALDVSTTLAVGTADAFQVSTAGTVTIATGQSYTGAGTVALSSAAASALTIESGTTGTITIGGDSSAETISIGLGAAAKSVFLGSSNTTSLTQIQAGSSGLSLLTAGAGNIALAPNTTGSVVVTSGVTTGTGTSSGLSVAANSLTTGTGLNIASSSLSSGALINLAVTGTAGLTNQKGINVSMSGANGTGAQTTYGGYFSNTHTGTSNNVGLYATATGGSNNYAAIFEDGRVGIGTTAPSELLHVKGGFKIERSDGSNVKFQYNDTADTLEINSNNGSGPVFFMDGDIIDDLFNVNPNTQKFGIGQAASYRFDVLDDTAAQTSTNRVANFSNAGATFNTTGGALSSYGGYFSSTSTRSAGANDLTNVGLYATASGAQNNYAAIFEAGFVGVETTAPNYKLQIGAGSTTIFGNTVYDQVIFDTNHPYSAWRTSGGIETYMGADNGAGYGDFGTASNHPMSIGTNSLVRMTIEAAGEIGIATSLADRQLEINSATGQNLRLTYNDADGSATNYADLLMSSGGDLTIAPSGSDVAITGNLGITSSNTTQTTTASALALNVNSLTTGTGLNIASSSLSSGALINLAVTGTAGLTNQKGINVSMSGANGTGAQTTYGGYFSNTHTGTSNNVGLYATASGGSGNYAAIFEAGNVGIGTTTPTTLLNLSATGTPTDFRAETYSDTDWHGPRFRFVRARNIPSSPSAVLTGDNLFEISALGYQNAGYRQGVSIVGAVDAAPSGNFVPSNLQFWLMNASTEAEVMRLTSGFDLGLGTSVPGKRLDINSATGQNLRLTYNDADGSATNYADLLTTSSGDLSVVPSGGDVGVTGSVAISSILQVASATGTTYSRFGTGTTTHSGAGNIENATDLLLSDDLEVDGDTWLDGNLTVTGTCTGCGGGSFSGEVDDTTNDSLTFTSDDASAPAGTVNSIFRDNTGDMNINTVTGKTLNLQIAGTDEYNFSSTALAMNSNNITGVGTAITATAGLTLSTAAASDLTLDSGTTGVVNLGTGNNAKTINVGTGNAGNAINIGTNNTVADTIAIGSALDSTTIRGATITIGNAADASVSIIDNNWSVTTAGVATFVSGSVIGSQTFTTNNIADSGALTIATGANGDLTLNPNGTGALINTLDSVGNINDMQINRSGTLTSADSSADILASRTVVTNSAGSLNSTANFVQFTSNISGTGTDTGSVLGVTQSNTSASGAVVSLAGAGTGNLISADTTNSSANGALFDIQSSSASQYALMATVNNGGTTALRVGGDGFVGLNTTGADRRLDILDASNPQLRLSQADGTVYGDLQSTTTANLIVTGDSLTGSVKEYGMQIATTINQSSAAGASYSALDINVTETGTSGLNGLNRLADMRVGGSSKLAVANDGSLLLQNASNIVTAYGSLGAFQNHLVRSEEFDNASWTKTSVTAPTANTQVAPDGSTTAESLATSGSGGDVCQFTSTAPGSSTFTFSVWARSTSGTQDFDLRVDAGATSCATANSTTGTAVTHTATTSWQRFSVTQTFSGASNFVKVRIFPGGTGGTGTIYAAKAQLEISSTANAYALTTGGALTNTNRGESLVSNFATASGFTYGGRHIVNLEGVISASSSTVGQLIRVNDNATGTDDTATVRGLEVQSYSGTNINGINTAIAAFGYTFGVHAVSTGQANESAQPAAVFADLDNGSAPTQGNAIRAYSNNLTSADLVSFYQETTTFTGNGLEMNFGNNSGTFSGNFISLQKAGTQYFHVDDDGSTHISVNGTATNFGICLAADGNVNDTEIVQCNGAPTDLAENFGTTDSSIEAGDVVVSADDASAITTQDGTDTSKAWITKSGSAYQNNLLGVVSTQPNQVYGTDGLFKDYENPRPVSLAGRVPVKVTNENGNINAGDYLTSSSTQPGKAMKATRSGVVIGQALSSYDGTGAPSVIVFVNTGFQSIGNTIVLDAPSTTSLDLQNGGENLATNTASTFVIQQQTADGEPADAPESNILQLQTGDANRFMVSSTGATSILSNLSCDPAASSSECPSVLKVTQANTELMNIDARGTLTLAGTIFIKDDSFAGSVATDSDGLAEITFNYHLGTGKPVVQLTAEAQLPVFAQIVEFKTDEVGNYTGFVMKTFDLISGPIQAIVHYTVVGKQADYITLGEVQVAPNYSEFSSGDGSSGSGDGSFTGGDGVGLIIEGGEVVGGDGEVSGDFTQSNPDDTMSTGEGLNP